MCKFMNYCNSGICNAQGQCECSFLDKGADCGSRASLTNALSRSISRPTNGKQYLYHV
jgi:hypothetical protein